MSDAEVRAYDAVLSSPAVWEEDWGSGSWYEKLLGVDAPSFSGAIGNSVNVPLLGEVTLVAVSVAEPPSRENWVEYDAPFHQGYEAEGFIVLMINDTHYRKAVQQTSYGTLEIHTVEDQWDLDNGRGLVRAKKVQKTVEVWE